MQTQSLAAYYQCHKRPVCFIQAVMSFRRHYPGATIVVSNDGGDDYSRFCASNNIQYTYYNKSSQEQVSQLIYSELQPVLAYLERLWSSFSCIPESHILLLEDDVRVVRRHTQPFEYTINGNNTDWTLPSEMVEALRKKRYTGPVYIGGCGGCVFDKTFLMNIPFESVKSALTSLPPLRTYASDVCLTFIALYFSGSVGSYSEFAETWYKDIIQRVNVDRSVAFLHKYNLQYNAQLTEGDRATLGWI
jgi:hypothetical protein